MESRTDRELLPLAHRFNQSALAVIYDRYNAGIYYYSLRLLGDPALAEDCTAETFHRFLRALRNGGGPTDNLKAYLYRTAHNWVTDHYRRTPPIQLDSEAPIEADDRPSQQAEENLIQARVRDALRMLTPEQRQVIALRFVEGWDLEHIAASLDKTIGAVKALQHRGVAALQRLLLDEDREENEH